MWKWFVIKVFPQLAYYALLRELVLLNTVRHRNSLRQKRREKDVSAVGKEKEFGSIHP